MTQSPSTGLDTPIELSLHYQPDLLDPRTNVSIGLPVYNAAAYLRDAIDSILNQTYPHFELHIFDDASTDESLDIIQSYNDPRIRVFRYLKNRGVARILNFAVRNASTAYVAIQNADDIWLPTKLEQQIAFLEANPDIGMVGTNRMIVTPALQWLADRRYPPEDWRLRWACLSGNFLHLTTVVLKRDLVLAVGGFGQKRHIAEDYLLLTKLISTTKVANIPKTLYMYRHHSQNISHRLRRKQFYDAMRVSVQWIQRQYGLNVHRSTAIFLSFPEDQRRFLHYKRRSIRRVKQAIQDIAKIASMHGPLVPEGNDEEFTKIWSDMVGHCVSGLWPWQKAMILWQTRTSLPRGYFIQWVKGLIRFVEGAFRKYVLFRFD